MATPHVTGAVGLVVQAFRQGHGGRSPSPNQIIDILERSANAAKLPGWDAEEQGAGRLDAYEAVFAEHYAGLMREKLGLYESRSGDDTLLRDLLELMRGSGADYTNVFRALCDLRSTSQGRQAPEARNETIREYFVDREAFDKWAIRYKVRLGAEGSRDEERSARMRRVNPKYVLRNYLAHTAIQMATEQKDFSEIQRLRLLLHSWRSGTSSGFRRWRRRRISTILLMQTSERLLGPGVHRRRISFLLLTLVAAPRCQTSGTISTTTTSGICARFGLCRRRGMPERLKLR